MSTLSEVRSNVDFVKEFMGIEFMNYDHFTYAIVLMYVIEIIDVMSFAYYNLIKVRCFIQKLNTMTYPCY